MLPSGSYELSEENLEEKKAAMVVENLNQTSQILNPYQNKM